MHADPFLSLGSPVVQANARFHLVDIIELLSLWHVFILPAVPTMLPLTHRLTRSTDWSAERRTWCLPAGSFLPASLALRQPCECAAGTTVLHGVVTTLQCSSGSEAARRRNVRNVALPRDEVPAVNSTRGICKGLAASRPCFPIRPGLACPPHCACPLTHPPCQVLPPARLQGLQHGGRQQ